MRTDDGSVVLCCRCGNCMQKEHHFRAYIFSSAPQCYAQIYNLKFQQLFSDILGHTGY